MRRVLGLAVVVSVAVGVSGCSRKPSQTVGQLKVNGKAEVVTVEGDVRAVTASRSVRAREEVRIVEGTGVLNLGGGRELEMRKDSVIRLAFREGTAGKPEPVAELVRGDVLAQASGDAVTVAAGDSTVVVTGAARVTRALAVVAGVYRGAAGIQSGGQSVSVAALRQRTVPAPGLASRPAPLAFSASDPWDQRFLGDAIDLGNQLVARSRGFSAQLQPGEGATADFFRQILPALAQQPAFGPAMFGENVRQPGETLIGAAITLEGSKGSFAERWVDVFGFHDDGAPWGLVALDQGVGRGALLGTIDAAMSRAPSIAAPAAPQVAAAVGSGPTSASRPAPAAGASNPSRGSAPAAGAGSSGSETAQAPGGGSGAATGSSSGPASTPANDVPPDLPPSGPSNLGVPLVDNTLNSVVEALSGLLQGLSTP